MLRRSLFALIPRSDGTGGSPCRRQSTHQCSRIDLGVAFERLLDRILDRSRLDLVEGDVVGNAFDPGRYLTQSSRSCVGIPM